MKAVRFGIVVLVAALAGCGSGASEGTGTGVVRGLDPAEATVTLEHGEIEGLMQAMTMTFAVADPSLLEGLEVGDEVDFRVRYADGRYTVTEIDSR